MLQDVYDFYFEESDDIKISSNEIIKNEIGIFCYHSWRNIIIQANTIQENNDGIRIEDSNKFEIKGNNISLNYNSGINLSRHCWYGKINNNTIHSNKKYGIFLDFAEKNNIENNTISDINTPDSDELVPIDMN